MKYKVRHAIGTLTKVECEDLCKYCEEILDEEYPEDVVEKELSDTYSQMYDELMVEGMNNCGYTESDIEKFQYPITLNFVNHYPTEKYMVRTKNLYIPTELYSFKFDFDYIIEYSSKKDYERDFKEKSTVVKNEDGTISFDILMDYNDIPEINLISHIKYELSGGFFGENDW